MRADLEEVCEQELANLHAIYVFPGELEDLRNRKYEKNGKYIPPDIDFNLGPPESRSVRRQNSDFRIKLHVKLETDYPESTPEKLDLQYLGDAISELELKMYVN